MYALKDAVLCQVHATFNAGAATLQLKLLSGTPPWRLPPVTTDAAAGTPTYGKPFVILTLMDVANVASAKIEEIRCAFSGVDIGSGVYEATACERGFNGTTDQSWPVGSLVLCQVSSSHLDMDMEFAIQRAQWTITHARDSAMTWDGTNFKFGKFRVLGIGNGKHFSTAGFLEVYFPANGSTVKGYGGASDYTVAGGVIVIPENTALYYEHNVATSANASLDANWRLVTYTSAFVVPKHWILVAHHCVVVTGGEGSLRVAHGATLYPWREVSGGVGFTNGWSNLGGAIATAAFMKRADQWVHLKGVITGGTVNQAAFTLPTGYRPSKNCVYAILSNNAIGGLNVNSNGTVIPVTPSNNAFVTLDGVQFLAEG